MKPFVVTVMLDKGQTICNPVRVEVGPGDTVRWTCEKGDLAVDFGNHTPFTSTQVWAAAHHQMTPAAIVKSGIRSGTVFQPTISIDRTVVAKSLGDIIFKSA